jgi:hypothetical protein
MACIKDKLILAGATASAAGAVGGTGLATTVGATVVGLLGIVATSIGVAVALDNLANCLEQNGQPEMARTLNEAASRIMEEVERLKQFGREHGVSI